MIVISNLSTFCSYISDIAELNTHYKHIRFLIISISKLSLYLRPASNIMRVSASIRTKDPSIKDSVFDMFRLDSRVIIITGGTGGIGYEVARGLAEAGANVSIASLAKNFSTLNLHTKGNLRLSSTASSMPPRLSAS